MPLVVSLYPVSEDDGIRTRNFRIDRLMMTLHKALMNKHFRQTAKLA
jgi:hypothetical protein